MLWDIALLASTIVQIWEEAGHSKKRCSWVSNCPTQNRQPVEIGVLNLSCVPSLCRIANQRMKAALGINPGNQISLCQLTLAQWARILFHAEEVEKLPEEEAVQQIESYWSLLGSMVSGIELLRMRRSGELATFELHLNASSFMGLLRFSAKSLENSRSLEI